jgi:imidazolonepropionase-like amidohydrolase
MMAPGDGTPGDDIVKDADENLLIRATHNAKLFLNSGVTTARENGAKNNIGFALQKAIRLGVIDGPDMVVCGRPITITGGHMGYCGSEADGLDEIKKETRKLIKQGADFIKIMATGGSTITSDPLKPSYTSEEMQLIVEEAHRVDKLTAAHCSSIKGIENALEAGVDMIIHCIFEDETGMYNYREDLAETLVNAQAWVNPTLHIKIAGIENIKKRGYKKGGLSRSEILQLDNAMRSLENSLETVNRFSKIGVKMMAGSDSPWGAYPPGEFVKEMLALNRAGLSIYESLLTGTKYAAYSIGKGHVSGILNVGRNADVLIVKGNPLINLSDLFNVKQVYKKGIPQYKKPKGYSGIPAEIK